MRSVSGSTISGGNDALVPQCVVVVGANIGGPQALAELLPRFRSGFPGSVVVIQKMRPGFTQVLVNELSQECALPMSQAEDGQALRPSRILVAPSGSRLVIASVQDPASPAHRVVLEPIGDSLESRGTCLDAAMVSAAQAFGSNAIGVLLSGLGTDGCEGMQAIANAGGITIAQDEQTSVVHALPAAAIDAGAVGEVLPLWNIAERINEIVGVTADAVAA